MNITHDDNATTWRGSADELTTDQLTFPERFDETALGAASDVAEHLLETARKKVIDDASLECAINSSASMDNSATTDINPGNNVQMAMTFDVPKDTVADELVLPDWMFSGGVRVKVKDPAHL